MSHFDTSRRQFLRDLGLGATALPFLSGLSSLWADDDRAMRPRKRLILMFSPNGTLPDEFWPAEPGPDSALELKPMLQALEPYREQVLLLKGALP